MRREENLMPELILYHFPGACSQVTVCALEEAKLRYRLMLINLAANEQSSSDYKSVSPLGKVPALSIDGRVMTENAALLVYIAAIRPEAGLFPSEPSAWAQAEIQAGLSFCGGTLHPYVRGIANPSRLTHGDEEPVRLKSIELANKSFAYAEQRLVDRGWWLGSWSIIDVYVNWAFSVARNNGFATQNFPQLSVLAERLAARPAFIRMQECDVKARTALGL